MKHIPYARQNISREDIEAVIKVLESDWLTQGPAIELFEQKIAAYTGAKYAVAVNSATSALHIACLAENLAKGHYLWTSPNTFVASANCALYCGAGVDFVDIDPDTYNLSVSELENKLKKTHGKKLPKVVIPVHFSGQPCDMEQIHKLSNLYGFTIIEDASHAVGAAYKNTKIGSCAYSDMTVLSFHPAKIITTAEGGVILTNREDLYEKLIMLRSHGITRNKDKMIEKNEKKNSSWYYEQLDLGFNYRITDLQAALGISQLNRLDEFIGRRQELAAKYDLEFKDVPVVLPKQQAYAYSSYHLYVVKLKPKYLKISRREAFDKLRQFNIGVNVHYIPVHTQPYYQKLGFKPGDFPQAEKYYEQAISLPMYYSLTDKEQDYVIEKVKEVLA